MLKYLIILLDDQSTSFCHYPHPEKPRRPMSMETLRKAIRYAMVENLCIQFVYPDYELSEEYKKVINTIDHTDIKALTTGAGAGADVAVVDSCGDLGRVPDGATCVLRITMREVNENVDAIGEAIGRLRRLNVVITDIPDMREDNFEDYKVALDALSARVRDLYESGAVPQLNILTDRLQLDTMNNCGAGDESVTLAPDGKFYICPAFYHDENATPVGDIDSGPDIRDRQLYRLDHAPICRVCDAYHCRRCIWLNRRQTLEVNTPGREQCVTAHLERNASREIQTDMRRKWTFMPEIKDIPQIDYLDPFDKIIR